MRCLLLSETSTRTCGVQGSRIGKQRGDAEPLSSIFWRKLEQVVCNLFLDVFSARTCWHVVSFHQLSALSISLHCLWSMWIATSAGDAKLRSTSLNNQRRGAIGSSLLNVVELGTLRGDTARTHSITM